MSKVLRFDDQIENHLNEIIIRLNRMGIKNVSRPMALRFVIEMNKSVQMKIRRKRKSKFGFLFQ